MNHESLFRLVENYRVKRKQHANDVWLEKWNVVKRWVNSRSGILEKHFLDDFNLASKDIDELVEGLIKVQPSFQEVERFQIKLRSHEFILKDRSYYLGLIPAIFGTILVVAAPDDSMKTALLIALGVLGLGRL